MTPRKPVAPTVAHARALFKETEKREGQEALAEYEAQRKATLAKTERLRAARLAREASAAGAEPKAEEPGVKLKAKGKKGKRP